MADSSILSQFKFTARQRQAATRRSRAIAVTAGAGSGKTRVLVGRYLHLLESGIPLRSLIAITFTEKAAREMRTRIRAAIEERLSEGQGQERQGQALPLRGLQPPISNLQPLTSNLWATAFTELDAARIGTIHSLCAEILRAHPAETGIDLDFTVLDEGPAAALQAEAVEAALAWCVTQAETARLIRLFTENGLRAAVTTLLGRRLDLERVWQSPQNAETSLAEWLDARLNAPAWLDSLAALLDLRARKPDDKLEEARRAVLDHWQTIREAREAADWDTLFAALAALRGAISTGGQKANWDEGDLASTREAMSALRAHYDEHLAPLTGKAGSISWSRDRQMAEVLPALRSVFDEALDEYQRLKEKQHALDFDDLEGRAARLLTEHSGVRERWQHEARAVLVDEFQDTNDRQRQIVYALTGFRSPDGDPAAGLFVVGDSKQSIYRFRGADVAVFRQVQSDIAAVDGLSVDLDLTFRAHQALIDLVNALLAPVLGEEDDPARPYQVPFARLRAQRRSPEPAAIREPFVEFHIGLGDDAKTGRAAAAAALANRLRELHQEERVEWGHVALLFRASTTFGVYEDALERAGIPFITVAGRGFYDRPEIRDLLNALSAIADPTDDLALAGLLRSPTIGLSDADLYRLRFPSNVDQPQPMWETLNMLASSETCEDSTPLRSRFGGASQDLGGLARAANIIAELRALAGRVPAAEVLKRYLDLTSYRAILSAAPEGNRLRRNVDKLLTDAHHSRLISLGDFLEYVKTLQDVGVREGEAPVEAGGAVQLMTVHKAKGLEFPIVVIADAAYEPRGGSSAVLIDDDLGLLVNLPDAEGAHPVAWRLASLSDAAKEDAEDKRLLYVAATRTKEKLIISGHAKRTAKGKLGLRGWLAHLGRQIGLDDVAMEEDLVDPCAVDVHAPGNAGPIACVMYPPSEIQSTPAASQQAAVDHAPASASDLAAPLAGGTLVPPPAIHDPSTRVWRVVSRAERPVGPAWVVGKLVHEALRRWRFPNEDNFDVFLWPFALETGLTDAAEIQSTLDDARRLLNRFCGHPLYAEIDAGERYHEVPYALSSDIGVIDLLYHANDSWTIVDFKTDDLRSADEMREAILREGYDAQVRRYVGAVAAQLGQRPRARLVFLRVAGEIQMVEL